MGKRYLALPATGGLMRCNYFPHYKSKTTGSFDIKGIWKIKNWWSVLGKHFPFCATAARIMHGRCDLLKCFLWQSHQLALFSLLELVRTLVIVWRLPEPLEPMLSQLAHRSISFEEHRKHTKASERLTCKVKAIVIWTSFTADCTGSIILMECLDHIQTDGLMIFWNWCR